MLAAVKLLCVGKLKERYYIDAFAEYQKRLGAFCRFTAEELPEQRLSENPSEKEIAAALDKEAAEIEKHIPAGAVLAAFCVEGKLLSSEELSRQMERWRNSGKSSVCFLIGGSCGLAERIKQNADLRLSVSRMTFPHHLFRVMAAEQIYRAFTISEGMKYHK